VATGDARNDHRGKRRGVAQVRMNVFHPRVPCGAFRCASRLNVHGNIRVRHG
jgi:hypothetical protein